MSARAVLHPVSAPEQRAASPTDDSPAALQRVDRVPPCVEDEFWRLRKRANAGRRRASLMLAVPLVALFGFVDAYVAPQATTELLLIRFGVFLPIILALLAFTIVQPLHKWSEAIFAIGVVVAGACVAAMTLIAPSHYAGILLVVFASYTFVGLRCMLATSAGFAITVVYAVAALVDASTPSPVVAINVIFLLSCNIIGAFVCYALEQAARRDFSRAYDLSEQRHLSERLLRNILPIPIARRLKLRSGTVADAHPDVTILFADIVDFTSYAATVAPTRLVELLDQIFTRFDRLAKANGVEKIKTIGDAYMVAGGLRPRSFDHVRAMAEMALDMLDWSRGVDAGNGRTLALRIGIHTGPVVAGVIGRTRFHYDLWGDTVNVASRLEELAMPGTIQVSEFAFERLRDAYLFSPRQLIPIKGRGELPCYRLLARASAGASLVGRTIRRRSFGSPREARAPAFALSPFTNAAHAAGEK